MNLHTPNSKVLKVSSQNLEDCNVHLTKKNENLLQENFNLQEDIAENKLLLQAQLYLHGKANCFKKTGKKLFKNTAKTHLHIIKQ